MSCDTYNYKDRCTQAHWDECIHVHTVYTHMQLANTLIVLKVVIIYYLLFILIFFVQRWSQTKRNFALWASWDRKNYVGKSDCQWNVIVFCLHIWLYWAPEQVRFWLSGIRIVIAFTDRASDNMAVFVAHMFVCTHVGMLVPLYLYVHQDVINIVKVITACLVKWLFLIFKFKFVWLVDLSFCCQYLYVLSVILRSNQLLMLLNGGIISKCKVQSLIKLVAVIKTGEIITAENRNA